MLPANGFRFAVGGIIIVYFPVFTLVCKFSSAEVLLLNRSKFLLNMQRLWIFFLLAAAFTSCKKEDPAVAIAHDMCGCIMPTVDNGERATEILRRGDQAEINALEQEMQRLQLESQACFENLGKKYGNLEPYKDRVLAEMEKKCPKAAALINGTGQQ